MKHTAPTDFVHEMSSRLVSRRTFLGASTASLALAFAGPLRVDAAPAKRIPIAVQLYSIRNHCAENFDVALEKVAAMGFEGVEFAGYYGYAEKPAALRDRLKALNLKAAGTHVRLDTLRGDALKATIEFHQTIGCKFLVVPMDAAMVDPEKSKGFAEEFNKISETLKPLGMACGYHNHQNEFKKDGDTTYWDLFATRTNKDVILQQDCGWTMTAGQDPIAYIKKYPGRTKTTHFKPTVRQGDEGKKPIIGQDSLDWKAIYATCQAVGGTEWVVVEQEYYPDGKTPMDCTAESLAGLKALLK
jgi:sugar phosphate isomerase/epimerase